MSEFNVYGIAVLYLDEKLIAWIQSNGFYADIHAGVIVESHLEAFEKHLGQIWRMGITKLQDDAFDELKKGNIMARMICACGTELNNQEAPNEIELIVYTDIEWNEICDCDNIQPWMIPTPKYEVWRCPVCKRIYVYEDSDESPIMIYRLET